MAITVTDEVFEELVDAGLRRIPRSLLNNVQNVALVVEDYNEESPFILGLYEGIALTERDSEYSGYLPDKITIYKEALCDFCNSEEELVEQVAITVIHELAHHFGIDDARLMELGWD